NTSPKPHAAELPWVVDERPVWRNVARICRSERLAATQRPSEHEAAVVGRIAGREIARGIRRAWCANDDIVAMGCDSATEPASRVRSAGVPPLRIARHPQGLTIEGEGSNASRGTTRRLYVG